MSRRALAAIAAAAAGAAGGPLFTGAPYLPPEIFEGDLITVTTGTGGGFSAATTAASPAAALGSPAVMLNNVAQGTSYQTIVGDAGKVVYLTQDAAVGALKRSSASLPVTIQAVPTFKGMDQLGGNMTGTNSTLPVRMYLNAVFDGARFANTSNQSVTVDANGWPTTAFACCISQGTSGLDGSLPAATWTGYYRSPGGATNMRNAVTADGVTQSTATGLVVGAVQGDGVTRSFTFTLAAGGVASFAFDGPITFWDIPRDGSATSVGKPMFWTEFLAHWASFSGVRTLDLTNANARTDTTWAQRPLDYNNGPQLAGHGSGPGQDTNSWERIFAILNAIAAYPGSRLKWAFINLPPFADDNYAGNLAALATACNVSIPLIVEWSNETWNSASSTRFHSYENLAMLEACGIANYELTTNTGGQVTGPGPVISTMNIVNGGTVTVVLTQAVNTLLDSQGNPFIVNGAQVIVNASKTSFNVGTLNTSVSTPITLVDDGNGTAAAGTTRTFTYQSATTNTTDSITTSTQATQMFFRPTADILRDNLAWSINSLRLKWTTRASYRSAAGWFAVRPHATYGDEWHLNMQTYAKSFNALTLNKSAPFELTYASWLGSNGGSGGDPITWMNAASIAPYVAPGASLTSVADLYDPANTSSLYYALNDPANINSVENSVRGHVYWCKRYGIKPYAYEFAIADQTSPSYNYNVAASTDQRTETFCTALIDLVFKNGIQKACWYHVSPRIVVNGNNSGQWMALQYYSDSINAGDSNYSARLAAVKKYTGARNYANVNGEDVLTLTYFQNASDLVGSGQNLAINGTNNAIYWSGASALDRNVDWVRTQKRRRRKRIEVWGTDSQATPVDVLMDGVLIGTQHVPANGTTGAGGGATCGPCLDTFVVDIPAGATNWRLRINNHTGTAPGLLQIKFYDA
ncbi:MAG: hypothetical protein ACTHK2_03925 [Dokdonella sp.]|uniref:hypothetical protein n=1 Tax=Dokdonella sp. TaxID=2291710 RepID=UPI003F80DBCE